MFSFTVICEGQMVGIRWEGGICLEVEKNIKASCSSDVDNAEDKSNC